MGVPRQPLLNLRGSAPAFVHLSLRSKMKRNTSMTRLPDEARLK